MDQNILQEVALNTHKNDNTHHQPDKKTVLEKEHEHDTDSRSADSGKPESEKVIIPSETIEDKSPATYELIFITIALVLMVFCVSLVNKYESNS